MNNPDVQYSSAQIDMFENNIYNLRHILMYISQYVTNSCSGCSFTSAVGIADFKKLMHTERCSLIMRGNWLAKTAVYIPA